jgi:uncharacterized repeat protein (TIGR01451 family)
MAIFARFSGALTRALGATLLALTPLAPAGAAATETVRIVSNTAQLEWDQGGRHLTLASNRVDISVVLADATLTAYRFDTGAGAQPLAVKPAMCAASTGSAAPIAVSAAWTAVLQGSPAFAPTASVRAGEPLFFAIDYAAGNADPTKVETMVALITTQAGDSERLIVSETGPDTGRFAGYIQTVAGASPAGDCRLGLASGDKVSLAASENKLVVSLAGARAAPLASTTLGVLVDRGGIVFDSADGTPVSGARVTLLDAATGAPAVVFGDDGDASFPAGVVSGETTTDSRGIHYTLAPGAYRFPLVRPGRYRLLVEAPPGYHAPSFRTPAQLAGLTGPDGAPLPVSAASYGADFVVAGPEPIHVAIPLDKIGSPIVVTKQASRAEAAPGETIAYAIGVRNPDTKVPTAAITVRDRYPRQMRLQAASLRVNGQAVSPVLDASGESFEIALKSLAPGASAVISYAMEVRGDAEPGVTVNKADVADAKGTTSNVAAAAVRVRRDAIADRVTIEGRVVDGACGVAGKGLGGVRIMLEDGSYAVTDVDGRYHFDGLVAGTHVVQMDDTTLPADRAAVDCANDTRSGGRAFSRFVDGRGGELKRVDFHAIPSALRARRASLATARPPVATDAQAAGAERDWFAGQQPGVAWLFPETDHNPRAPIVRVAIKHRAGQKVSLLVNGRETDPIAFEGDRKNGDNTIVISQWRGIPLEAKGATELTAEVRNADGSLAETLHRIVRYGASPMRAELVRERSVLVADGVTRPVIAVRFTDSDGRPVRHGLTGDFEVPAPYYPAVEADAQQARQLAGLERARPVWHVTGEEGIAYIELEPTTASGSVSLRFPFRDGQAVREQRLEMWLDPGDRPWTIVGLAEGTLGYNRLDNRMERLGDDKPKLLTDGRLALYAKGRILGKWLMTLAYDSKKKEADTRFGGAIDPNSYYTVYADRSERRYDAASVKKLYLKLERPQFYALFGDFQTGIDEPQLARYVRAFTGGKAEYRSKRVAAIAYAADAENRHRRDDIQGNGLSGPYALGARNILPNSEQVRIEVRDRLRSEKIVETHQLARYVDYEIDYLTGIVRFKQPILSRDSALNPQFIVADYEVDGVARRRLNAGGRASWKSKNQKLQVAATGLHDATDAGTTNLVGADVRYKPNASTEVRAEVAVSDNKAAAGSAQPSGGTATAWLVEAEHHGPRYDALAYARQQDKGFGVGQLSGAENGTRKVGFDGRVKVNERISVSASGWVEDYLGTGARRIAGKALVEYKGRTLSGRAGLVFADDRLQDGRTARSTLLQLGATKRLLANKLELDAQTEIPLAQAGSIDFPAQHRFTARYTVKTGFQLVGAYEIAKGKNVDARTARVGFDIQPWAGAKIALTANQQDIAEYGPRSFAAFGLSQSVVLGKHWSLDASLDSNRTLHGIDPTRVLNPLHPVASGGFIGSGSLTEDFTAVTGGATYRARLWSVTGRAEYRAGSQGDRYGVTAAALRQIGDGSAVGLAFDWFTAKAKTGAETRTANLQLSWAHRPAGSAWSWLEKLEAREDAVTGAVAGRADPIGALFTISGNARSRRAVNSLSLNWSPGSGTELALFWGTRYASDRIAADDIKGFSNLVGADIRFDLSSRVDVSIAASVRESAGARAIGYAIGPSLGVKPLDNGWISLGWNLVGFHDRDFEASRYTRAGPYVTARIKFDQLSLRNLGLGR